MRIWVCFILLALVACNPSEKGSSITAEDIAANNRGVGLMGYFDYNGAHEVFTEIITKHPDWNEVKINLAIATLNLQTETSENDALNLLAEVLVSEPDNLRAHFCHGLLNLYQGDTDKAMAHFKTVADADPSDAFAAYYLGQCHARQSQHEKAREWYEKAIAGAPYLRSAYYGLFQTFQRLGDREQARAMLDVFQKLEGNPQARQAEFKYTRMGPKANASVINMPDAPATTEPQGPVFSSPADLVSLPDGVSWNAPGERAPAVTSGDIDGDGDVDLLIPNAISQNGQILNGVFINESNNFTLQTDHPLSTYSGANAILWGDENNDGLIDFYICRKGENTLLRQDSAGSWSDVTEAAGATGGNLDTVDGLWLDADHDGDLDIFMVNADGPNELLNNNLDGTFRILASGQGIAGDGGSSRDIVAADLDNDRDVDLIVLNESQPHEVYINDRLWSYSVGEGFDAFKNSGATAVIAADGDTNGQVELYALTSSGLSVWEPADNGEWQSRAISPDSASSLAGLDAFGSGRLQFAMQDADGWRLVDGNGQKRFSAGPAAHITPVTIDPTAGPAMLSIASDGAISVYHPGTGRHPFVGMTFSGKEDTGASMRSNAIGVGTKVSFRTGSRWFTPPVFVNSSTPGQGLAPVSVGLGGAQLLDFVAITWSDGVFQTELNLETGKVHRIEETQRQLSSCPVLFVWNGEEFEFVSDLLGVGGMGYAVAPGEYATPRPWENFQLPNDLIKPKDGLYQIKIAEPMEEACYLDSVGMTAWDLPPGWHMVLDERMGLAEPLPTGEPRFYRRELLPQKAVNDREMDVTASIQKVDHKAAETPPVDHRFIGYLTDEHILTLDFATDINGHGAMLVVDGWVEYPYSQTNFAAWQASRTLEAPTLEALGSDGKWTTVLKQFGYPAGMPRRMSVPLDSLPKNTKSLRLRTNQEIYWDRIAVAYAEPCPEARRNPLKLQKATLADDGFAKRTTAAQRLPQYNDGKRAPLWDARHQAGFYTELGEVTPLLDGPADDALAIFGPGEAVTLAFLPQDGAPQAGWTRVHVLETAGWCKDMDLYTLNGETLGPLPTSGKPKEPREQLHTKFNTRYRSGY